MKVRFIIPVLVVGALLAMVSIASGADSGKALFGGVRNPTGGSSHSFTSETEIMAKSAGWSTRQSNKGSGGGAIYGCRTVTDGLPCLRAVNLTLGNAFQFVTSGNVGGQIKVSGGGDGKKPFTTNATGVATGLNADRVDSKSATDIVSDAVTAAQAKTLTAQVSDTPTLLHARGATSVAHVATGKVDVTFGQDVSGCVPTATIAGGDPGQIAVQPKSGAPTVITVSTAGSGGTDADRAFNLVVTC
jgi:hypothetical protein